MANLSITIGPTVGIGNGDDTKVAEIVQGFIDYHTTEDDGTPHWNEVAGEYFPVPVTAQEKADWTILKLIEIMRADARRQNDRTHAWDAHETSGTENEDITWT